MGDVHIKRVFRRRERVRDLAAHQNRRAGRLGDQIERDGVEIAADPSVHLEFAQPRDDGRRREPGGAREGGGLRCVEPERQRGSGRVERPVDVAGERYLRRAGVQGEIERQRLFVARERAGQRGLAEGLGANVGVDVEERGHALERICRAFDREIEARLRCDRARHARDRDARARGVVDRRPAHGNVAVVEGGVELQPGQANAAVGERIDAERDIGVDLVEYGPEIVARAIRRRLCRLLRCIVRPAGPGLQAAGGGFVLTAPHARRGQVSVHVDRIDIEGRVDQRSLAGHDRRVAGDPRRIDPDVEVACRYPVSAGGEIGDRAEAAQPIRRDCADIDAEPGEDGAQVLGRDLGDALHPGVVAGGSQPADEVDLGAARQQRRGRPERDHAVGEGKMRRGLTNDARAPGKGIDREVEVGFDVRGNCLPDVVRDRLQGGQRGRIAGLPCSGRASGRSGGLRRTGMRQEAIEVDAVEVDLGIQPRQVAAFPRDRARRLALAEPHLQLARGDGVGAQAELALGGERAGERLGGQRSEIHGERIQQGAEVGRPGLHAAVERRCPVETLEGAFEQGAPPLSRRRSPRARPARCGLREPWPSRTETRSPCRARRACPLPGRVRPASGRRASRRSPRSAPAARRPHGDRRSCRS